MGGYLDLLLLKWVFKYMDCKNSPWKAILDLWLQKGVSPYEMRGRGVMLTKYHPKTLCRYVHSPTWRLSIKGWAKMAV